MVVAVTDEIAAVLAGDRSELAAVEHRRASGGDPPHSHYGGSVRARQPAFRRGARPSARSIAEHAAGGFPAPVPRTTTVHAMNRGIFVSITKADVVDLYRLRRMLEGGAARRAGSAPVQLRQAVSAAVEDGEAAAVAGPGRRPYGRPSLSPGHRRLGAEPSSRRDDAPGIGGAAPGIPCHDRPRAVSCALSGAQPRDRGTCARGVRRRGGGGAVRVPD